MELSNATKKLIERYDHLDDQYGCNIDIDAEIEALRECINSKEGQQSKVDCDKCRNQGRMDFCAHCTRWHPEKTSDYFFAKRDGD